MVELYTEQQAEEMQALYKKNIIITVSVLISSLVLGGVLCFFVNDDTAKIMNIVISAVLIIGGWISIYFLIAKVLLIMSRKNFLLSLFAVEKVERDCSIKEIGKVLTLRKDVTVREVYVIFNKKVFVLYWDMQLGELPFKEGEEVVFYTLSNYITAYEVKQ